MPITEKFVQPGAPTHLANERAGGGRGKAPGVQKHQPKAMTRQSVGPKSQLLDLHILRMVTRNVGNAEDDKIAVRSQV